MNPERILIAAEGVGLGKVALKRATQYAKERVVFNRPTATPASTMSSVICAK
jgi:acyl-CoA dehydrogenase